LAERLRERSDNAILAGAFSAAGTPEIGTKTDRTNETDAANRETDGTNPPSDAPDPNRS